MGSYLSAPMLVFRLGVLPRACETPCGDGSAGPYGPSPHPSHPAVPLVFLPSSAPSRQPSRLYFFSPSSLSLSFLFLFRRISPSPPLLAPSSIVSGYFSSLSIFNLLSHISRLSARNGEEGEGEGGDECEYGSACGGNPAYARRYRE